MKKCFVFAVVSSAFQLFGASATCFQTHPVLYRDGKAHQPLIAARLALDWGGTLRNLAYTFTPETPTGHLADFRLWKTTTPWFITTAATDITPHFNVALNGETLSFTHKTITGGSDSAAPFINKTGDYLWLTAQVKPAMPADAKVDVALTTAPWINGQAATPANAAPEGTMRIFPHAYRVAPYYRANLLQPNRATDTLGTHNEVFANITDIYLCGSFGVACNTTARTATLTTAANATAALQRLKDKRAQMQLEKPSHHVGIHLCIMTGTGGPMASVVQAADLRTDLADRIVAYVNEHGYDGVDIDYEFPFNPSSSNGETENHNYALFMAELKQKLFPTGKTLSIANPVSWGIANAKVCASCDWVNIMTYDGGAQNNSGGSGDHSTYAHMISGVANHRAFGVPDCRLVVGLPFYTNETTPYNTGSRNWDAQRGWANVVASNWSRDPDDDYCTLNGQRHNFNGPTLIRAKADWIKRQKLGGGMIWAYDTDLTDWFSPHCLGRILSRTLYPESPRTAPPETDADGYALLRTEADLHWFAQTIESGTATLNATLSEAITLTRDFPMITATYSGHLRGPGSIIIPPEGSICSFDGAALFKTLTNARISGLTLRVEGRIDAARHKIDAATASAAGLALSLNAGTTIEGCTLILGKEAAITSNHEAGLLAAGIWVPAGGNPAAITRNTADIAGLIRTKAGTGTGRLGGLCGQANQGDSTTKITLSGNALTLRDTARLQSASGTHTAACALLGNRNTTGIALIQNATIIEPGATFSAASSNSAAWPHAGGLFSTAWSGSNAANATANLLVHRAQTTPAATLGANATASCPTTLTFPSGTRTASIALSPAPADITTDYPGDLFAITDRYHQRGTTATLLYHRSGAASLPIDYLLEIAYTPFLIKVF